MRHWMPSGRTAAPYSTTSRTTVLACYESRGDPMSPALPRLVPPRVIALALTCALLGAAAAVATLSVVATGANGPNPGPFIGCLATKAHTGIVKGDVYAVAKPPATAPTRSCLSGDTKITFGKELAPSACEAMAGTYLETGETQAYDPVGTPIAVSYARTINLFDGGGMSVDFMWDFDWLPSGDTEQETDREGIWSCTGTAFDATLTARTLDVYRYTGSFHDFSVDRVDWTGTLTDVLHDGSKVTLAGSYHLCWFELPFEAGFDIQSAPCLVDQEFDSSQPIEATRISVPAAVGSSSASSVDPGYPRR